MKKEPIDAPALVLVGSSGRNAGKTVAACALIRALKGRFPITALKVTVADKAGVCHRGKAGCGACSFSPGYILEEESGPPPGKDTARLLAAGAARVFWLRAARPSLAEGFRAFLEKAPPGSLVVGESNSLREEVRPGCFIMLKNRDGVMKPSAARVADLADISSENDGAVTEEAAGALASRLIIGEDGAGRLTVRPTGEDHA
ncbi:MAG: hypothetical protein LBI91_06260 [Spirochaetaceae bacterium]|jgi:hypothetical protein|nr:hypothetical protein [Spirochaetaceae bacterium]